MHFRCNKHDLSTRCSFSRHSHALTVHAKRHLFRIWRKNSKWCVWTGENETFCCGSYFLLKMFKKGHKRKNTLCIISIKSKEQGAKAQMKEVSLIGLFEAFNNLVKWYFVFVKKDDCTMSKILKVRRLSSFWKFLLFNTV